MAKMPSEMAITMPTPPRGKRTASGAPMSTKTRHANGIASFFWYSTSNALIWSCFVRARDASELSSPVTTAVATSCPPPPPPPAPGSCDEYCAIGTRDASDERAGVPSARSPFCSAMERGAGRRSGAPSARPVSGARPMATTPASSAGGASGEASPAAIRESVEPRPSSAGSIGAGSSTGASSSSSSMPASLVARSSSPVGTVGSPRSVRSRAAAARRAASWRISASSPRRCSASSASSAKPISRSPRCVSPAERSSMLPTPCMRITCRSKKTRWKRSGSASCTSWMWPSKSVRNRSVRSRLKAIRPLSA